MGSTRLPGKVLLPIGGRPMVLHVLERATRIGPPVVLATSKDPEDDELATTAGDAGYAVSRGSRDDVLDRFVAAIPAGTNTVVRVTADCPLFDPAVGRGVLAALDAGGVDYVSNTIVPTFPDGLDCWAVRAESLRVAWREATLASDREHVMPYIWRQPELFRVWNIAHAPELSSERWTVDDARDLEFVRAVNERLVSYPENARHSMYTVLQVLAKEPALRALNAGTTRDEGYARSVEQDRAASAGEHRGP